MILESTETRTIELGITDDDAITIDQCHSVAERGSGRVGEGVGISCRAPLRAHEPRLARQLGGDLPNNSCVQSPVYNGDDCDDEDRDYGK